LGHGWALPLAGTLAVIGHCWPIYTRFHGGMGLATAGSMIFVITPITLAFLIPAWVILFFLIFKKQYSPRSVALALLVSIPLRLWLVSADIFVNWFLILVGLVLVLRHLPEWNRKV
jgi:glycerol-3-phosphate acyltransferase PlsY